MLPKMIPLEDSPAAEYFRKQGRRQMLDLLEQSQAECRRLEEDTRRLEVDTRRLKKELEELKKKREELKMDLAKHEDPGPD